MNVTKEYRQASGTGSTRCFGDGHPRTDVLLGSGLYPEQLAEFPDPPRVLRVLGNVSALAPGIAIVGARKATPYGESCAERFGSLAAMMGITVISGGAIGCDQAALRGALSGGGKAVTVLGSGADVAYPKRGTTSFELSLSGGGAVISELPWGAPPQKWAFKKRNRIIAGLARAVLIVEAGLPSGTFSTADCALEGGREVMVVPGSILSKQSAGSNRLLREGATPIIDDETFLDEMARLFPERFFAGNPVESEPDVSHGMTQPVMAGGQLDATFMLVMDAVAASPMTPDELASFCGLPVLQVIKVLSSLETMGAVCRYPDGRFGVDPRSMR